MLVTSGDFGLCDVFFWCHGYLCVCVCVCLAVSVFFLLLCFILLCCCLMAYKRCSCCFGLVSSVLAKRLWLGRMSLKWPILCLVGRNLKSVNREWLYFTLTTIASWFAFSAFTLLVGQQEGQPACKKTEWWDASMVVCLGLGADLHMAQLMPLPLTISCSSKSRLVLPFWCRLPG